MISDTQKVGCVVKAWFKVVLGTVRYPLGVHAVAAANSQRQHAGAVRRFPPEQKRKLHLVFLWSHENVITITRTAKYRGQSGGMTKRVRIEAYVRVYVQRAS